MTIKLSNIKPKRIKKLNGGMGAILCNTCWVILKAGSQISKEDWESDEPIYCENCKSNSHEEQ